MNFEKILPSQRNILVQLIADSNLELKKFDIQRDGSIFKYTGTDYFFHFITGPQYKPHASYSPGRNTFLYTEEVSFKNFNEPESEFSIWLENLEREINEPDLFEILSKQDLKRTLVDEETFFTEEEKKSIIAKINEIRKDFEDQDLIQEQLDIINKKLDDAADLLNKMNRGKWKTYFIGTIFSLVLDAIIPLEIVKPIWENIKIFFIKIAIGA